MLLDTLNPKIERLDAGDDPKYGKFMVEPLERGYGTTLGNALRRVLLSSIRGAAITNVRIQGVLHEFSTIPGVVEDVTEVLLNVKELAIKVVDSAEPGRAEGIYTLRLERRGPGEVTAADIEAPPEVEIINRELHLATLDSEEALLSMEFEVATGTGYVPSDEHDRTGQSIGTIPVDSIFTPVRKAAFRVEPTRVGHLTDFDRLVMEVGTNGTLSPSDAISEAAKILDRYLILFFDFSEEGIGMGEGQDAAAGQQQVLDLRVDDLDFSVRTLNCLRRESINTVGELITKSDADLMRIRNFGRKSLSEVKEKLASLGLALREDGEYTEYAGEEEDADFEE